PYTRIWFSNPNSWVRVVDYRSMTASEELPLEVVIEARGLDWGESATEHIRVKLDEEETIVTAEIQTKPKPAAKPKPAPKSQPKQQQRGAARKPSPTIKWPSKRKLKIAAYVIGGLVVLVTVPLILINILSKHEYDQPAQSGDNKAEETVAPDFTLQATSGEKVTLSKFRGQPVILAFWHICPSSGCKVQESVLQAFYEKQTYGSLKLITVNVGGSPLEVEQYAAKNNLTFPILLDTNWDVSHDYGPFGSPIGFPRTVFIDARGYITTYRMGPFKSLDDIEKAVDSIWPSLTKTPYQSHQGQIAFASDRDGNEEIYVMNADGSGQMRLTFDPAEDG
ncbi:MAG: redoxin domain-containing protein, partial [Chloroflexi bacterium]|nr:redoxin domain-containing protein [Chloroflexota bacterium]